MFNERKRIPFVSQGPGKTRCYARDYKRWSIVEGEAEDDFLVKVVLKKGWGVGETISTIAMPTVAFLIFGAICVGIWWFDPGNEFVRTFFIAVIGICAMLFIVHGLFIWSEVNYFESMPEVVLTIYEGREFTLGNDSNVHSLPVGSILQYTLHHPTPGAQGESSKSELDLLIRDGDEMKKIHKLMAHQENWCWRHAKKLSEIASLPLKRVPLQSNGKRFPPALLD
jgi:hypothetical protein